MNEDPDPGYVWKAGWSATRLHAISASTNWHNWDGAARTALCQCWVYANPKTKTAERRLAKGVKRCRHCEKMLEKMQ